EGRRGLIHRRRFPGEGAMVSIAPSCCPPLRHPVAGAVAGGTRQAGRLWASPHREETALPAAIHQPVDTPLTQAAMFLTLTMAPGPEPEDAVRSFCAELSGLLRSVGFRDPDGRLSCILGLGSGAWDRLFGIPRPRELHPFREIRGVHHAVATPGD